MAKITCGHKWRSDNTETCQHCHRQRPAKAAKLTMRERDIIAAVMSLKKADPIGWDILASLRLMNAVAMYEESRKARR